MTEQEQARRAWAYTDDDTERDPDAQEPEEPERPYRDGSAPNECWGRGDEA